MKKTPCRHVDQTSLISTIWLMILSLSYRQCFEILIMGLGIFFNFGIFGPKFVFDFSNLAFKNRLFNFHCCLNLLKLVLTIFILAKGHNIFSVIFRRLYISVKLFRRVHIRSVNNRWLRILPIMSKSKELIKITKWLFLGDLFINIAVGGSGGDKYHFRVCGMVEPDLGSDTWVLSEFGGCKWG